MTERDLLTAMIRDTAHDIIRAARDEAEAFCQYLQYEPASASIYTFVVKGDLGRKIQELISRELGVQETEGKATYCDHPERN